MLDCSKIDELMMDWLYQELDESSSARVAEHVQGCARCASEASALQRTREAFRELSPVEPPVAVSAILLHEAARRAPAVASAPARGSEEGFWGRVRSWFRPIAMHPAAAAIATLVLVAGVAGTLYVRHGDEMTDTPDLRQPAAASEPVGASESPKREDPAVPALDIPIPPPEQGAVAAASDDEQSARPDRDGYSADVLGSEAQKELSKATAKLERAPADTGKSYSIEKKPVPTTRSKKAAKPAESKGPIANVVSGADPLIEGEMDLKGGIGGGGTAATRGRAADKMQQAAQPPAAPPTTTSSTTPNAAPGAIDFADGKSNGDSGGYRVYKQKPMTAAELKASEGKIVADVKKKDCLSAARIANDILDRNGEYAYKRVASQTKPCQMYVSQERARRASKNVGSGKNVAAPAKAKAAPQKDEAAQTAE